MGEQIGSVRAIVRIQTPPEFDPLTGVVEPGHRIGFDTMQDEFWINRDLLKITTNKKLSEPCGRATLEFAPRRYKGKTWADMIPNYSLIEIFLQRHPENSEPVLVFLGLTDSPAESEEYGSSPEPHRRVTVSARELSCVLVDVQSIYLPVPPESLTGRSTTNLPGIFGEKAQLLGVISIAPELAQEGDSPADVVDRFIEMVTVGLKGRPLLDLQLPLDPGLERQLRLADYLVYDRAKAARNMFDPNARLPAASQLTMTGASIWNLLDTWSDPVYQELFTQTVDARDVDSDLATAANSRSRLQSLAQPNQSTEFTHGVVEVVFRKKPFGGKIAATGKHKGKVDPATTRGWSESQFDKDFEADETNNLRVDDRSVIGFSVHRSIQNIYNVYYVRPQIPNLNIVDYQALFPPLIDDNPDSPSSVGRFGPRLFDHFDYYFKDAQPSVPQDKEEAKNDVSQGMARSELVYHWYHFNPLFLQGSYTLKGNPRARVGMRFVHTGRDFGLQGKRGAREFYTTAVTHSVDLSDEVHFVTRLSVERGWPIPER